MARLLRGLLWLVELLVEASGPEQEAIFKRTTLERVESIFSGGGDWLSHSSLAARARVTPATWLRSSGDFLCFHPARTLLHSHTLTCKHIHTHAHTQMASLFMPWRISGMI